MKVHPITNCYPMMSAVEMARFVADIRKRGLLFPVTVQGDTLLDGRNRTEACRIASVQLRTVEYTGDDAVGFIHSTNERRDLTVSQRAMIAAKIAKLPHGSNQWTGKIAGPTQTAAAAALHVSERLVRAAKTVLNADPDLANSVAAGEMKVHVAEASVRNRARLAPDKVGEAPAASARNKPAAMRQKEIVELLAAGHNRAQIAALIGVNASYIFKFMREHGMTMPEHAKRRTVRQHISATRVIRNTVEQLTSLVPGLQIVRNGTVELSREEATMLLNETQIALKAINWVTKTLREHANG